MDWLTFTFSVSASLLGSQLVTPWVQGRVDRRKHRGYKIATWRAMLARHVPADTDGITMTSGPASITTDPDYWSLRAHLDQELVQRLEAKTTTARGQQAIEFRVGGPLFEERSEAVARAIDDLERRWRLI